MSKRIKKIGVLTSGGDSPGMNAAIRSVVRACAYYNVDCMGIYRGYQGMIEGDFKEMGPRSVHNIVNKGGTILKSARSKEFMTPKGRAKAFENLKEAGIEALVVIGGDGSFTGAEIFNREYHVPVIGIPGTIDNDIYGTSHTLGYDTALNTVVEVIDKIRDTASSHNRLFFVEVMGRDAGHIALNTGIGAGAEEILIPEEDLGLERLLESLRRSKLSGKYLKSTGLPPLYITRGAAELGGAKSHAAQRKENVWYTFLAKERAYAVAYSKCFFPCAYNLKFHRNSPCCVMSSPSSSFSSETRSRVILLTT